MEIRYKIDIPDKFTDSEKDGFLALLKKQGQVENPNLEKLNLSRYLCIAYSDGVPIGIGALKNVYTKPFEYAGVSDLKSHFEIELGYLFVDSKPKSSNNYRGLGIGKTISQYLLKKVETKNVFATTELIESNAMLYILRKLGFESVGNPYEGKKTNKIISLMILNREK